MAAAAVAATSAAGCSGPDPKEEFVDAADELCRTADEQIAELRAPRVEEGIEDYVTEARRIAEDLVSGLRDLEPPPGDEDVLRRLGDGFERVADLLDPLAEAAAGADSAAIEDLQDDVEAASDEISDVAESYGFEECDAAVLDPLR